MSRESSFLSLPAPGGPWGCGPCSSACGCGAHCSFCLSHLPSRCCSVTFTSRRPLPSPCEDIVIEYQGLLTGSTSQRLCSQMGLFVRPHVGMCSGMGAALTPPQRSHFQAFGSLSAAMPLSSTSHVPYQEAPEFEVGLSLPHPHPVLHPQVHSS